MLENHAHVVFLRLICLHLIPNLCCWIFDFSGANLKEKSERAMVWYRFWSTRSQHPPIYVYGSYGWLHMLSF